MERIDVCIDLPADDSSLFAQTSFFCLSTRHVDGSIDLEIAINLFDQKERKRDRKPCFKIKVATNQINTKTKWTNNDSFYY
jgi:hypothetical protein